MKFYPYKRLNRPVGLRVTSVSLRLPDRTRDHLDTSAFSTPQRTVALGVAQHEDWLSARIGLSATLPPVPPTRTPRGAIYGSSRCSPTATPTSAPRSNSARMPRTARNGPARSRCAVTTT